MYYGNKQRSQLRVTAQFVLVIVCKRFDKAELLTIHYQYLIDITTLSFLSDIPYDQCRFLFLIIFSLTKNYFDIIRQEIQRGKVFYLQR